MNQLKCEMCGSTDLIKQDGMFVCQVCGTRYSVEEAKKLMIEGTVDVQGTVKVDNSGFVKRYLENARRALSKDDWEEVEKYYNLVEQNSTNNIEAVFFSAYGKAMLSLTDQEYFKRQQKFEVLNKSISVINDYYEVTEEDKEQVLKKISEYIQRMYHITFVYNINATFNVVGSKNWCIGLLNSTKAAFLIELKQIAELHNDEYIQELIKINQVTVATKNGCYVATCVYGSYDCPEVWTLRRYRDNTLGSTRRGRAFIKLYYAISPILVKWFGKTKWFKKMWRGKLDRMVHKLQEQGVESTPYEDIDWRKQ